MEPVLLVVAFAVGFAARSVGLPPLVGYLVAGFVLHALGFESTELLDVVAEIGILLLLFGIGLKLRIRTLAAPRVWLTATAHAAGTTVVVAAVLLGFGALGLPLASRLEPVTALLLGFAFSFSSTVFAVKSLERANESASLAGRLAVGVLIVQDVFAVAFLVAAEGGWPSAWALVVIPVLLLLRPLFGWLVDRSGHGEMLVLLGFTLAVSVGAGLFALVDLKADLGALVAGLLLSGHPRAGELSDRLLGLKDLFLVGFFLSIGLAGTPSTGAWAVGLLALVLVPVKAFGFLWAFTRFRLRARTALHGASTLATYSEFGLIVGAAAVSSGMLDPEWLSAIAVSVSVSFVLASAAATVRYRLSDRLAGPLGRLERDPIADEDSVIDCGYARVLVFGMGRVGTGAYDEMRERKGPFIVGVDRRDETVAAHRASGRSVIRGDALDRDFWERIRFHPGVELVIAAMNGQQANLELVRRIEEFLPAARIAAIAMYPDQVAELHAAGVDVARNLYEEAGQALADDAIGVVWEGEE
jgi:predicted Kef-type K+ transport protein